MANIFAESIIEQAAIDWLKDVCTMIYGII
jgi:hypothetical protein